MINPEQYITEGLTIIKTLIAQGNLRGALSGCTELLKINPYHRAVQKTYKNIEELIVKENERKVDTDIDSTMHLWKEERYEDLLLIYNRLYPYAPNYTRLLKLMTKLQSQLSDQHRTERQDYIDKALKAISQLLRDSQYGDAIQACNELLAIDPLNSHAKSYLENAQNKLIDDKLKTNERLLESSDLDRILEFYNTLLSIRPDHTDVQRRALQVRAHLAERKILAEKIHLNESIARMRELFKTSEYEKVLQAAEEIERLDPGNISSKIFREKALDTMRAETDSVIVKKLKDVWTNLAPEYKKSPGAFVKV